MQDKACANMDSVVGLVWLDRIFGREDEIRRIARAPALCLDVEAWAGMQCVVQDRRVSLGLGVS
jgi:hypothetical protein